MTTIGLGHNVYVGDTSPTDGRHYTKMTCTGCTKTGWVLTSSLPLHEALNPVRGEDGTRQAVCATCAPKPNRAARRRK